MTLSLTYLILSIFTLESRFVKTSTLLISSQVTPVQLEYRGKDEVRAWFQDCTNAFQLESSSWGLDVVGTGDDPSIVIVHAKESVTAKNQSRFRGGKFDDVETLRIFEVKDGKIVHIQHMVNDATVIEKVRELASKRYPSYATVVRLDCIGPQITTTKSM
jgi:hypothetical protein